MDEGIPAILLSVIPGLSGNWGKYCSWFKKEEVPPKRILLREGETAKRIYFVDSGAIRMYFTDENKDVTLQFFFSGSHVCSMESFLNNVPGRFNLETLEESVLYTLSKERYDNLIVELPAFNRYFQDYINNRMFYYVNLLLDHIRLSPRQRYDALLEKHPEILQRVAQYHIASYLGITSVSYSRIRNRR